MANTDLRPRLLRIAFAPSVFAFGLGWRLFAGSAASALFNALTLTLLGNPRWVLHLLLVVQPSVNLGAFLALV
jgi:hypothetical protein